MTVQGSELFGDLRPCTPTARRVVESSYRLDASYFSHGAEGARVSLASSSLTVSPLRELADVFALSDFSLMRIPAVESRGVPFLTVSEILEWTAEPSMFLSRKYEPNLDDYIVKEGWILLSRAGTVGKTIIVGKDLAGKAVANHAIRIMPKSPDLVALIYLVLRSQLGQQILTGYTYGSVVGVIKPDQIEQVPIPIPHAQVRTVLRKQVDRALAAREGALQLHREAIIDALVANGLKDLCPEDHTAIRTQNNPQVFPLDARSIQSEPAVSAESRLDAHFYNPTARLAVANIRKCRSELKTVAAVTEQVLMGPRFKRNYVEATHGVPFLSGKNIIQIRPTDLKHLSNLQMADMQDLLVKRGWTLITCSGTLGRTCFVWKNYEDYAASQHILRVVPDESVIDAGYLYAFLSSQYGYEQILRYRHGSVIDEVNDTQIKQVLVPVPARKDQVTIGDKVREAYEKRAEAIRFEDEAQAILAQALTEAPGVKEA
jgi:type I restriction enzyme S subunit